MTYLSLESLRSIRALVIDMDGVLWRGDEALPGVGEFFSMLRANSFPFRLATNNSSRTPEQYVAKLAGIGVAITTAEVLTSAVVTAQYVAETFPGGSVYYIGQDGVQKALLDHGLALSDEDRADAVVVGLDPHLTYEKLRRAAGLIRAGARFVGCNPDVTLPHGGDLLPGNGATLAFLEAGTGIQPVIIGKPEPAMFEAALESMNVSREETATLGDRLETDILGGRNAGLRCILVLSGVTDAGLLQASSIQPDWVFENVAGLVKTWKTLLE